MEGYNKNYLNSWFLSEKTAINLNEIPEIFIWKKYFNPRLLKESR